MTLLEILKEVALARMTPKTAERKISKMAVFKKPVKVSAKVKIGGTN